MYIVTKYFYIFAENTAMKAKLFTLAKIDFVKALFTAIIGAFLGALWPWINDWLSNKPVDVTFKETLLAALKTALVAALSYLGKNWLSNSAGQFATSEAKAAEKKAEIVEKIIHQQ